MVEPKGIERVDAQALSAQRLLTEALWLSLQGQGVKNRTSRRVECFFIARADSAVGSLLNGFPETAEWRHEVSRIDDPPGAISVKIITPLAYLSREALLELVDVMMIAANESGCVFDGFQVDVSNLQQRPWWKFW
jgi:ABC-type transporter Mla MlaB component